MLSGDLRSPSASRRGSRPRLPAGLRLRRLVAHMQRGPVSSCNQEPLIEGCSVCEHRLIKQVRELLCERVCVCVYVCLREREHHFFVLLNLSKIYAAVVVLC